MAKGDMMFEKTNEEAWTPRMKVWILDEHQVVGLCPFCGQPHLHGRGESGRGEGARVPHCRGSMVKLAYILVPQTGPPPPEILKALRRRPRGQTFTAWLNAQAHIKPEKIPGAK